MANADRTTSNPQIQRGQRLSLLQTLHTEPNSGGNSVNVIDCPIRIQETPTNNNIPWLPGVSAEVCKIVGNLAEIQNKFQNNGRFHLILVTEVGPDATPTREQSHIMQSEIRVLFSPTISFTVKEASARAHELAATLSAFAIIAKTQVSNILPNAEAPIHAQFRGEEELLQLKIPSWFPGQCYKKETESEISWKGTNRKSPRD